MGRGAAFDGIVAGDCDMNGEQMSVEASRTSGAVTNDETGRRRLGDSRHWYLVPLLVYAVSRLVDALIITVASRRQVALTSTRSDYHVFDPTPAAPGYGGVVANWDGQWYWRIATRGYEVPASGSAEEGEALWAWAFPPVYPLLVRGVMTVTRLPFNWAASLVSVVAGAVAMMLMYRLVRRYGGPFLALVTVTLSCFFISAPLLQIAYSESLALAVLFAALNLLADRRYGWATSMVVLLAYTRLVTLPLAFVVLAHAVARWRAEGPFWRQDRRSAAVLCAMGVASVAGAALWMLTASLFIGLKAGTGRTVDQRELFQGWFRDVYDVFGAPGLLMLIAFVVLFGLNLVTRRGRIWGPELRAWSLAYLVYLFWFTPLLPAVFRYLLLVPTLVVILLGTPVKATRGTVGLLAVAVVALVIAQFWYAGNILVVFTEEARPGP
ncbi:hypothetical protein [Terrabacter sp. MAHUQ-38]|uniref:hypothetical protein n=1 Tax=unclassified Terrabacter TaxID=2630222 RepID=UPI00165E8892|nr:hypothetical protein [Terrabacter sp. MAHUQ-38]MBC9822503.1 hypothetical protein [Terrabacter sp. MAHUQ-38]